MKPTMLVIDGNNWFRRREETSILGSPMRSCFNELQASSHDVVIIVWDGFNALQARRNLYDGYKRSRKPAGDTFYEYQKLFKKVVIYSKAISVEIAGYEGDDVVAAIVNHYRSQMDITIESNDADFAQLCVPMTRKEFPIPAQWVTLYKTLVGDNSDNIKGIPNFGKAAWDKMTDKHRTMFLNWLRSTAKLDLTLFQDVFKKSSMTWLADPINQNQLRCYFNIVNFIPIKWDIIEQNMKAGTNDNAGAELIFKEWMA